METVRALRKKNNPLPKQSIDHRSVGSEVLVAITSCQLYEDKGWNQPLRDTWLPELRKYNWDYRFFHGRGSTPGKDIVVVDARDDYHGSAEKANEKCKWALKEGYPYIFLCFPDTYVCVDRLAVCGFRDFDYYGKVAQRGIGRMLDYPLGTPYCEGGPGFFLSRKAMEIFIKEPIGFHNDDCCVGESLYKKVTMGNNDNFLYTIVLDPLSGRYIHNVEGPLKTNTAITSHLSGRAGGFTGEAVYREHKAWLDSLTQK
jgi:hypothetical protein